MHVYQSTHDCVDQFAQANGAVQTNRTVQTNHAIQTNHAVASFCGRCLPSDCQSRHGNTYSRIVRCDELRLSRPQHNIAVASHHWTITHG